MRSARITKALGLIVLVFFVLFTGNVKAQTVKLLSISQLEDRINNGGDTVYVVNFWATWCAPCIAELPYFEKLQSVYKAQPLKVLLVSLDFKSKLSKVVIPFVRNKKLNNEVYLLNEPNAQEYIDRVSKDWSGAIPATLVYNKKKNVRKFYEKEFTYAELETTYQSSK
ncbi:redoxin domain-containing protein [Paradesertivirga mongoliensis]|uniref:Redoxin domain-containing protein n=1 Tax=Paradesertivirga mongoliensis TaxID=2100740 RepID=A0ABW4ZMN5_9SPHI|nr:redoxin domain-containing protein [Pedobacter mongoliensis]